MQRQARIPVACMLPLCGLILAVANAFAYTPSDDLEIPYINTGKGGSTLIIGPNGTRILYDFGNVGGRLCYACPLCPEHFLPL